MNREIKFRCYLNGKEPRMVSWEEMIKDEGWEIGMMNFASSDIYKWMQYTGIIAEDGREIYEGDIVSLLGGRKFVVVYGANGIPEFSGKDGKYTASLSYNCRGVLGNIYENPELMEKKDDTA